MSWTKLSAIAELVSSIAILATLGYLAVQTQQNTAAIVSNSRQESLNSELAFIRMIVDYPETDMVENRPMEEVRPVLVGAALLRIREHQWLQYREGLLDEQTWQSYFPILIANLQSSDALRTVWNLNVERGSLDARFIEFVQGELAKAESRNE